MFTDPSLTKLKTLSQQSVINTDLQAGKLPTQIALPTATSKAISGIMSQPITVSATEKINGIPSLNQASVAGQINTKIGQVSGAVSGILTQANSLVQSTFKAITGPIDGLAKSLDKQLSGVFTNKTDQNAATTTTTVSDPIKTLLTKGNPTGTQGFVIKSIGGGSTAITIPGINGNIGSNADLMQGVNTSSLLGRFNLDSVNGLLKSVTDFKSELNLGGLFSSTAALVTTVRSLPNQISQTINGISTGITRYVQQASSTLQISGDQALSFAITNPTGSLVDANGNAVDTHDQNVDSSLANGLLELARAVGCDVSSLPGYSSGDELASSFNALLQTATSVGLTEMVDKLLQCSYMTTPAGQLAGQGAFIQAAGTYPDLAASILNNVVATPTLAQDYLVQGVVTNNSLTAASTGDVAALMTALGTTTQTAYTLNPTDPTAFAIYDYSTLDSSALEFVDATFGDTSFSTYLQSEPLTLSQMSFA